MLRVSETISPSWTMNNMTKLLTIIGLFFLFILPFDAKSENTLTNKSDSELSIGVYLAATKNDPRLKDILLRTGGSYFWANIALTQRKQPKLYCQPNVALNEDNYFHILEDYVDRNKWILDFKFEGIYLVLLDALTEAFPCK